MLRFSVPSLVVNDKLSQATSQLRNRLDTVSTEAVTGRRADVSTYLDGQIGTAKLSQKLITDIASEREQQTLRASRLSLVEASLGAVDQGVGDLHTQMLTQLASGTELAQRRVSADAASTLDGIFSALNARLGQRHLFSGDATSHAPFGSPETLIADLKTIAAGAETIEAFEADVDAYFTAPDGPWLQSIYQGTTTAFDRDAVTANDPALVNVIRSVAILAAGTEGAAALGPNGDEILTRSAEALEQGKTDLVNLRADVGIRQARIDQRLAALDTEETVATEVFNNLTARDQFDAATELQELQTNLEAAYLLTNRLSGLSLVNFLR